MKIFHPLARLVIALANQNCAVSNGKRLWLFNTFVWVRIRLETFIKYRADPYP